MLYSWRYMGTLLPTWTALKITSSCCFTETSYSPLAPDSFSGLLSCVRLGMSESFYHYQKYLTERPCVVVCTRIAF